MARRFAWQGDECDDGSRPFDYRGRPGCGIRDSVADVCHHVEVDLRNSSARFGHVRGVVARVDRDCHSIILSATHKNPQAGSYDPAKGRVMALSNMTVFISAAVVLLIGCASLSATAQDPGHSHQPTLRTEMLVSTFLSLQEHLGDSNLVIVCVGRDRSGYDAGHIPGALFLAIDQLVEQHANSLNDLPPVAKLQSVFESIGAGDDVRIVYTETQEGY